MHKEEYPLIYQAVVDSIKHQFPNEISIADFMANYWYQAVVNGKSLAFACFRDIEHQLPDWARQYGFDNIEIYIYRLTNRGRKHQWICLGETTRWYQMLHDVLLDLDLPFISIGDVSCSKGRIVPKKGRAFVGSVFKNEILYRFFMDQPCYIADKDQWPVTRSMILHCCNNDAKQSLKVFKSLTWMQLMDSVSDILHTV